MWIFIIIISLILLFIALYLLLGAYICVQVSFPKKKTFAQLYRMEWKENFKHNDINPSHAKIILEGRNGYSMFARYFEADEHSHKYAVLLHGHNNSSMTCGKYALMFNAKGINCLAPDLRCSGDTGGKGITFGYYETKDVEQWIDEIYKKDPKAEIGLFGISLGAATAIMTASLRNDIKYLISYCSYASYRDIVYDKGKEMYPKLIKLFYPALILSTYLITKARVDTIDIVQSIKKVNCPTLILHSKDDGFTNFSHAIRLKEAKEDAIFRSFEKVPHARAYSLQPELYKRYVYEFLDNLDKA